MWLIWAVHNDCNNFATIISICTAAVLRRKNVNFHCGGATFGHKIILPDLQLTKFQKDILLSNDLQLLDPLPGQQFNLRWK